MMTVSGNIWQTKSYIYLLVVLEDDREKATAENRIEEKKIASFECLDLILMLQSSRKTDYF